MNRFVLGATLTVSLGPAYGAVFEADPATGDFVLASLPALFAPIDIKIVSPAGTET